MYSRDFLACGMVGPFPAEIANLKELTYLYPFFCLPLDPSSSLFVFPSRGGNISKFPVLFLNLRDLSENTLLTGSIGDWNLTKLVNLYPSFPRPSTFCQFFFVFLQFISYMDSTRISSTLPAWIGDAPIEYMHPLLLRFSSFLSLFPLFFPN